MKTNICLVIAVIFVALLTMAVDGKSPTKTTKIKDVLAKEQKTLVLSHLRGNPDPRDEAIYNLYAAKKQSEKTTTTAELSF